MGNASGAAGRGSYATKQGALILDYLASLGGVHVTVSEITRKLSIGQTTVYRHLEKLCESGVIRKYDMSEGGACYQYVAGSGECREHFHLKCEKCGELIHLDCDVLSELEDHILKEHRFRINGLKTIFYGTCGKCLKRKGN